MNFSVTLPGLAAKVARVKGAMAPDALEEIAKAGADVFEDEMRLLCPLLDGDLRDSIRQLATVKGVSLAVVAVGPTAIYAARTEFGHSLPTLAGPWPVHQAPHSFVRAAFDGKEEEAKQAQAEKAREILSDVLK